MRCSSCGAENREGALFCSSCGLPLGVPSPLDAITPEQAIPAVVAGQADGEPSPPPLLPEGTAAPQPAEEAGMPTAQHPEPVASDEGMPLIPDQLSPGPEPAGQRDGMGPTPAPEGAMGHESAAREGVGFVPLAPGSVLADRYLIVRVLEEGEDRIRYHGLDLTRCVRCGFEANELDDAFCAQCGAAMDVKPGVALLQLQEPGSELAGEDAIFAHGHRLSSEAGHFVVTEALELQPQELLLARGMRLVVGQSTDAGKVRKLNEDSLLSLILSPAFESRSTPVMALLAVADGMGGHEGGEIASRLALQVLARNVIQRVFLPLGLASDLAKIEGPVPDDERASPEHVEASVCPAERTAAILKAAAEEANDAVYLARQKRGNDMGTTLTAALICDDHLLLAHVGDSRAYRWSAKGLEVLTSDHSVIARMIAAGDAAPEDVYTHPHRNVIYRSIGDTPLVDVDISILPLGPGDTMILCSDGLWEMVRDEGIEDVMMTEGDPQCASELLVKRANLAGGSDNISVIVAKVEAI